MSGERLAKRVYESNVEGVRGRGRPPKRMVEWGAGCGGKERNDSGKRKGGVPE